MKKNEMVIDPQEHKNIKDLSAKLLVKKQTNICSLFRIFKNLYDEVFFVTFILGTLGP